MLANDILELLKKEIPFTEYERYVKQLIYNEKESKSSSVVFNAPNVLILNWANTKYADKISSLYEQETGFRQSVKFILKNKKSTDEKSFTDDSEKKRGSKNAILNPSYNFDNFIVGSSNNYAYTVAKAAATKPGIVYNPIFIYGPTGIGKTHLIHAIGNYAQNQDKVVIYATSEQFLNDYIHHNANKIMDRFREKYRKCDFLLVDDVQFFSNKIQTQEEFFHTFNELHSLKKQIILTSDKPPKVIDGIDERLKSRFEWGLIADIGYPELETKIAIINKKCELDGISLNKDIVDYIASNMGDNIREIESAIINLNAYAMLMRQKITLDFAKNVIKEQIKEHHKDITSENIIQVVSKEMNIKPSEIKSKKRSSKIVEARRICIYLARTLTPNSMPSLAAIFGMKDHTAVSHNMKKINELIKENESFRLKIDELQNKILTKKEKK